MRCITVANRNIKAGKDKQNSYLYKSLSLVELSSEPELLSVYSNPVSEILKGIRYLESYKSKHPSDYFHSENRYRIDKIVRFSVRKADSLYASGDIKHAEKLFLKLRRIYPDNKLYLYKYAKLYRFNSGVVLEHDKTLTKDVLYSDLYYVFKNIEDYFKADAENEFLSDLKLLYADTACDLQAASMILVLYPQKFNMSENFKTEAKQFAERYYQIKMLFEVNNLRTSGTVCGGILTDSRPPLILSNCLCKTAQEYASYIRKEDFFSHAEEDDSLLFERVKSEGCPVRAVNIALISSSNISGVIKKWAGNEKYCKNIVGFYRQTGFGKDGACFVQLFK